MGRRLVRGVVAAPEVVEAERVLAVALDHPSLGRSRSWLWRDTRRGLNEVFLQFDYDNAGGLGIAKVRALFMRYAPQFTDDVEVLFNKFCRNHSSRRLEYRDFVSLVDHQQRRGRFACFEPAAKSEDLMQDAYVQERSRAIQRLLDRIDPRPPEPDELKPQSELPKAVVEPFRGIRSSINLPTDIGKSLLMAVNAHEETKKLAALEKTAAAAAAAAAAAVKRLQKQQQQQQQQEEEGPPGKKQLSTTTATFLPPLKAPTTTRTRRRRRKKR